MAASLVVAFSVLMQQPRCCSLLGARLAWAPSPACVALLGILPPLVRAFGDLPIQGQPVALLPCIFCKSSLYCISGGPLALWSSCQQLFSPDSFKMFGQPLVCSRLRRPNNSHVSLTLVGGASLLRYAGPVGVVLSLTTIGAGFLGLVLCPLVWRGQFQDAWC